MENTHTAIIKFRDGDSAEVKGCAMMGVDASGNVLVMEMGTGGSGNGAQQGGYTLLGKQVHEDKGGKRKEGMRMLWDYRYADCIFKEPAPDILSLIHISEPTRPY